LDEAINFLRQKRPQIGPNENFLLQLVRYEAELIKSKQIDPFVSTKEVVDDNQKTTETDNSDNIKQSQDDLKNPIETLDEFVKKEHDIIKSDDE